MPGRVGEIMSKEDETFMNSVYQMDFATQMIRLVLVQANEMDKNPLEFQAIRASLDAIVAASEDKDKCLLRILKRVNKMIAKEYLNG